MGIGAARKRVLSDTVGARVFVGVMASALERSRKNGRLFRDWEVRKDGGNNWKSAEKNWKIPEKRLVTFAKNYLYKNSFTSPANFRNVVIEAFKLCLGESRSKQEMNRKLVDYFKQYVDLTSRRTGDDRAHVAMTLTGDLTVCITRGLSFAKIRERTEGMDSVKMMDGKTVRNPAAIHYYRKNTIDFFANSTLTEINWFTFAQKYILAAAKETEAFFKQTR